MYINWFMHLTTFFWCSFHLFFHLLFSTYLHLVQFVPFFVWLKDWNFLIICKKKKEKTKTYSWIWWQFLNNKREQKFFFFTIWNWHVLILFHFLYYFYKFKNVQQISFVKSLLKFNLENMLCEVNASDEKLIAKFDFWN